jgi:Icc-related predicted phosphoesterase
MLVVSDVHGAFNALRRVVSSGEGLLILGDLANLTDYRTGDGAVATAFGLDLARQAGDARGEGNFEEMRRLWRNAVPDADTGRRSIELAIEGQYVEMRAALEGGSGYVIHGNVDRPDQLIAALPSGFRYVHGQRLEIDGLVFGFVGGGVRTPMQAVGEIDDGEMEAMLESLGPVDVLCTHVPPAVASLHQDVVTGRAERSSAPIYQYISRVRPRLHLFGDVHQPQATRWRVGPTVCHNVGYFRATGRAMRLDTSAV